MLGKGRLVGKRANSVFLSGAHTNTSSSQL